MTYQFYVFLYPYKHEKISHVLTEDKVYPMVGTGGWVLDSLPLDYPFDRPIDEGSFHVGNSYFQDIVIYHKKHEDLNVSHSD